MINAMLHVRLIVHAYLQSTGRYTCYTKYLYICYNNDKFSLRTDIHDIHTCTGISLCFLWYTSTDVCTHDSVHINITVYMHTV